MSFDHFIMTPRYATKALFSQQAHRDRHNCERKKLSGMPEFQITLKKQFCLAILRVPRLTVDWYEIGAQSEVKNN
jgi:hypothetical protein